MAFQHTTHSNTCRFGCKPHRRYRTKRHCSSKPSCWSFDIPVRKKELLRKKCKGHLSICIFITGFLYVLLELTNRKWFSVVCTLIDNDIRHYGGQNVVSTERVHNKFLSQYSTSKKVFISVRDQNHDTKKEQALSITFSQYDWFISQNGRS